jgi:activating signal cointegrator complex subunit 3
MENLPRLSHRLLLNLYGQECSDTSHWQHQRVMAFPTIEKYTEAQQDFSIDNLVAKCRPLSSSEYASLRSVYTRYLECAGRFLDSESLERNSFRVMYNIIVRNKVLQTALEEAIAHFGSLARDNFGPAFDAALAVFGFVDEKSHGRVEFGTEIVFPSRVLPQIAVDKNGSSASALYTENTTESNDLLSFQGSLSWLLELCKEHTSTSGASLLSSSELAKEILKVVHTSTSPDVIQNTLFDLLGETGFGLMAEVVQNLPGLTQLDANAVDILMNPNTALADHSLKSIDIEQNFSSFEPMSLSYESMSLNQRRKFEQRERKMLEKALQESALQTSSLGSADWLQSIGFSEDYLLQERALGLQKGRFPAKFENWTENLAPEGTLQYHEKRGMPAGTEKKTGPGFEEIHIPAPKAPDSSDVSDLILVSALDGWAQLAFPNTKYLNRIQSRVFNSAFNTSQNMLVCAPTGAGKTNIAMLALLQLVKQHIDPVDGFLDKSSFKAVYIAPMKALAQEVVAKFAERLAPLGLVVKEFTGSILCYSCSTTSSRE